MIRKYITNTFRAALLAAVLVPASAQAKGFQDFARALGIDIFTVKREETNVYKLSSYRGKYLVQTQYCYVYASYGEAFIYKDVLYFLDSNESCPVKQVYRE